ncbi:hypothetical protein [uncultured Nocardioides sp.]|nr:hypothetical protein [uncultured Nocardioides sp.]|tara:strand:- start:318 stop:1271 length:954 start_codon:yes stop_codon:yes gene_type:complete
MVMELVDPDGILLRRDVIAAGYDDKALRRQVTGHALARIRQGAYCLRSTWESSSREQRHLLMVKAVCRQYGDDVSVSHLSAALWWGAPLVGVRADAVHLTHLDGEAGRRQAGVVHHRGACHVGDVTRASGHWVTSPTRTALDSCLILPRRSAVCVLDWFLHQSLTTIDELRQRAIGMGNWPGSLPLMHLLALADSRAESPGETLVRLLIHESDIPDPVSQLDITDAGGAWLARVDFAWPEKMALLEFDGLRKLTTDLREGETALDAVVREKRREDRLREAGWLVIRVTWDDVIHHPARTVQRIRAFLAMADRRPCTG